MTFTIDPQRVLDGVGILFTICMLAGIVYSSFKNPKFRTGSILFAGLGLITVVALCSNCAAPPLSLSPGEALGLPALGESRRDEDSHKNCRIVLAHYCRRMSDCGATDFERCLEGVTEGCAEIVGITDFETKRCAASMDLMECTSQKIVPNACAGIGVRSTPVEVGQSL